MEIGHSSGNRRPEAEGTRPEHGRVLPFADPRSQGAAVAPARAPHRDAYLHAWVAADPASLRLTAQLEELAADAPAILIAGETGCGKDLLATLCHHLGSCPEGPLIKFECSLPADTIETALFGRDLDGEIVRGEIELANGGTLVIDEVAALPMEAQERLLHVIEDRQLLRVDGAEPVPIDVRVVALTTVNLLAAVTRRSFREDLYYLLNLSAVEVPPLRDRKGDIRPLGEYFLRQLSELHRKQVTGFSPGAIAALDAYSFPGNVAELRTIIARAVASCATTEILLHDLPPHVRDAVAPQPTNGTHNGSRKPSLEEVERAYITEVLEFTRGRKSAAANILGISRKTLLEKRKRYGLG